MMDMNFDVNKIFQERLASSIGLDKYQFIIKQVKKTNVSTDASFQRTFNGFYLVRRRKLTSSFGAYDRIEIKKQLKETKHEYRIKKD